MTLRQAQDATPRPGETYFFQQRPVTIIKVDKRARLALVRGSNVSRKLDFWVTWGELGVGA